MIVLERYCYGPDATMGRLYVLDHLFWTIEQPWRGNRVGESCIPEGRYTLERDTTGRFTYFKIPDAEVKPRSAIEIHPANQASELKGCIAPGMDVSGLSVVDSRDACDLLLELLPERVPLWIRQYRPEGM